jgi:hypothetical protein
METRAQTLARLLSALEDLSEHETLLLRAEDYTGVLETQQRAAPVVERLTRLADAADGKTRQRIAAVLAKRQRSYDWLSAKIACVRGELRELQASQRRIAQIAPAYGRAAAHSASASQLSAVG